MGGRQTGAGKHATIPGRIARQKAAIRCVASFALTLSVFSHDPNAYEDSTDPYDSLPPLEGGFLQAIGGVEIAEPDDDECAIRNGGLAMLYYHYVRLFGGHDGPEIQRQFRQYCQLDSAAMVMAYDFLRRGGIQVVGA